MLTRAGAVAAVAGAGWVAGPALSAEPYVPTAKDFEGPLAGVERIAGTARSVDPRHQDEGPVTHLSAVMDSPARFDVAGLTGEMRPVELRGRIEGGEWTDWTETANGDPVWFGGMDELQLRTRGYAPKGSIHYVNVSGDTTPGDGALTGARRAISGVVTASVGLLNADVALGGSGSDRPKVIRRGAWGANDQSRGCKPRRDPSIGGVKAAVIHHTVNAVNYSEAEAPGMVLAICRYHRNGNGWDDIGYNVVVDRFGNIYEGRDGGLGKAVTGAHAQGVNYKTTGVAVLGTHTSQLAERKTVNAIARWLAWKLPRHGRTTKGKARIISQGGPVSRFDNGELVVTRRIFPHRVVNYTECPGGALKGQIRKIKRKTQRKIDRAQAAPEG
jgi:hypothetical protein